MATALATSPDSPRSLNPQLLSHRRRNWLKIWLALRYVWFPLRVHAESCIRSLHGETKLMKSEEERQTYIESLYHCPEKTTERSCLWQNYMGKLLSSDQVDEDEGPDVTQSSLHHRRRRTSRAFVGDKYFWDLAKAYMEPLGEKEEESCIGPETTGGASLLQLLLCCRKLGMAGSEVARNICDVKEKLMDTPEMAFDQAEVDSCLSHVTDLLDKLLDGAVACKRTRESANEAKKKIQLHIPGLVTLSNSDVSSLMDEMSSLHTETRIHVRERGRSNAVDPIEECAARLETLLRKLFDSHSSADTCSSPQTAAIAGITCSRPDGNSDSSAGIVMQNPDRHEAYWDRNDRGLIEELEEAQKEKQQALEHVNDLLKKLEECRSMIKERDERIELLGNKISSLENDISGMEAELSRDAADRKVLMAALAREKEEKIKIEREREQLVRRTVELEARMYASERRELECRQREVELGRKQVEFERKQLDFERVVAERGGRIEQAMNNMKYELSGIVKREVSQALVEGLSRHRSGERPDVVNEVPSASSRATSDY